MQLSYWNHRYFLTKILLALFFYFRHINLLSQFQIVHYHRFHLKLCIANSFHFYSLNKYSDYSLKVFLWEIWESSHFYQLHMTNAESFEILMLLMTVNFAASIHELSLINQSSFRLVTKLRLQEYSLSILLSSRAFLEWKSDLKLSKLRASDWLGYSFNTKLQK